MFDDAAILKQPRGRGRPTAYSDEIADTICRRISLGESLVSVTNDPEMPCRTAVYDWISERHEFADKYARARQAQAEGYIDEIISISDGVAGCTDSAVVNAARLAIDTRKWVASKLLPKKYGDKIGIDSTGSLTIKIVHGLGDPD